MNWFLRLFRLRMHLIALQPTLWLLLIISAFFAYLPIHNYKFDAQPVFPIAIINLDGSETATIYLESLRAFPDLKLIEESSLDEAKKQLSIGKYEGILQVNPGFSEAIAELDLQDLIMVYVSPSSSAANYLPELFVGKALDIITRETIIRDYQEALERIDQPLTSDEIQQLRQEILEREKSEELVRLIIHQPEVARPVRPSRSAEDTLRQSAMIYCALVIIFLITSSRWVIDQRRSGIGLRMRSLGITPLQAVLASSLAMTIFCSVVLLLILLGGALFLGVSLCLVLEVFLISLLYFMAVVGLALIFSSLVKESISLLLISPLAILINTLLGGMLQPLPDWALVWERISVILPGRMLNQALIAGQPLGLLLGVLVYFGLGVLLASLNQHQARQEL
jgi:hypothetical protein